MSTLYVTEPDAHIRKVDERIQVVKDKKVLVDIPLIRLTQAVFFGSGVLTGPAIQTFLEHRIPVIYMTPYGKFLGRLEPETSRNVLLRKAQYRAAFDPARQRDIAERFVAGKLANQRTYLVRANRERHKGEIDRVIGRIKVEERALASSPDVATLMGREGAAAAAYFEGLAHLLPPEFRFEKRVRRPPRDPVNALLSFGYTLLFGDLLSACSLAGFDPYVGYLHADRYGKASLALDLSEEFRTPVVDSVVMTCINKRVLTPEDFREEPGGVCLLTDEGRKKFLVQYESRKQTTFRHPVFDYEATYLRAFELQARLLGKYLLGETEAYVPLAIR